MVFHFWRFKILLSITILLCFNSSWIASSLRPYNSVQSAHQKFVLQINLSSVISVITSWSHLCVKVRWTDLYKLIGSKTRYFVPFWLMSFWRQRLWLMVAVRIRTNNKELIVIYQYSLRDLSICTDHWTQYFSIVLRIKSICFLNRYSFDYWISVALI